MVRMTNAMIVVGLNSGMSVREGRVPPNRLPSAYCGDYHHGWFDAEEVFISFAYRH